jgi:hypothetical protein
MLKIWVAMCKMFSLEKNIRTGCTGYSGWFYLVNPVHPVKIFVRLHRLALIWNYLGSRELRSKNIERETRLVWISCGKGADQLAAEVRDVLDYTPPYEVSIPEGGLIDPGSTSVDQVILEAQRAGSPVPASNAGGDDY